MTRRFNHRSHTTIGLLLASTIVVASVCLSAACAPAASGGQSGPTQPSPSSPAAQKTSQKTLSGRVTYLQRVALPAGATIEVSLDDVSLADAPSTRLGSVTITTNGENVPIPFTLTYDPTVVRPERSYAVSARITIDGQLRWISSTRHAVLTAGNPIDDVTITVQQVPAQPQMVVVPTQGTTGEGPSLIGRWQLERIDYTNDKTVTPSSPDKYRIDFQDHGILVAQLDCNRGRGGYKVSGSTLSVDPILSTLMACGGDSIAGQFTKALQTATSFRRTNDTLVLSMSNDAGAMHLMRLP